MFRPLSLFIGLRYTRAKRRQHWVSLTALIAMFGIALGVIVLITVLSVINGFDREIKKQLFGMIPPITISGWNGQIDNWQEIEQDLQALPNIKGISPFAQGYGLLQNAELTQPAIITGILPDKEKDVSKLASRLTQGNLADLIAGRHGIVLGKDLAQQLGVKLGDSLTIATQKTSFSTSNIIPMMTNFTVVGIFHAGGGGMSFDSKLAFINLQDAQKIFQLGSSITAIHAGIENVYAAPEISLQLENQLTPMVRIGNWTEQLGDFFENINMTKTMMFFIFILIIAVAAFNLICTMIMAVKNKQAEIAILRTLGTTPFTIMIIFIIHGTVMGIGGTVLGIIGGVTLALNITAISNWIQSFFDVSLVSSQVYFVDYLPSELQWGDVGLISFIAIVLSMIATIYPAWNASRIAPADALRNE